MLACSPYHNTTAITEWVPQQDVGVQDLVNPVGLWACRQHMHYTLHLQDSSVQHLLPTQLAIAPTTPDNEQFHQLLHEQRQVQQMTG